MSPDGQAHESRSNVITNESQGQMGVITKEYITCDNMTHGKYITLDQ